LSGGNVPEDQKRAEYREHGSGSARHGIDHRQVGDLIAPLQAQAIGEMDQSAEHHEADARPCPDDALALHDEIKHPGRIGDAGDEIIAKNED
jgi:hypothetical protein